MKLRNAFLIGMLSILISCSSSEEKKEPKVEKKKEKKEKQVEWTYSGAFGPKFWGDLDPSFLLCKEGEHQSPINLIWKQPSKPNPLDVMYNESKAVVEDTGHAIKIDVKGNNSIKMRNSIYNLQGIHFHTPSEHHFSGKSFPAEIHFVHKNDKGYLAVIGVMVKQGNANPSAEAILKNLPPSKNAEQDIPGLLTITNLMPEIQTLYNYAGSLTTPPCTEGVNWIVYNTPIEFSAEQLETLKNRYPMNNRPIQPLNDRVMVNYADSKD